MKTTPKSLFSHWLLLLVLLALVLCIGMTMLQCNRECLSTVTTLEAAYGLTDGYIYFGRPSCPSCELFLPVMELAANNRSLQIHYFNSDYFRSETDISDDALMEVFDHFGVVHVPLLLYLEDGAVVEAFGAEISGSREQSMVYGQLGELMDRMTPGLPLTLLPGLLLWVLALVCVLPSRSFPGERHLPGLLCLGFCGLLYLWYRVYGEHGLQLWQEERKLMLLLAAGGLFSGASWYQRNRKHKNGGNSHENTENHHPDPGPDPAVERDDPACPGGGAAPSGEPGQLCDGTAQGAGISQ